MMVRIEQVVIYCAGLIALICGCGTSVEELPSAVESLDLDLANTVSRPTVVEQTNDVTQPNLDSSKHKMPSTEAALPAGFDDANARQYIARRELERELESDISDDEVRTWNTPGHHYPTIPPKDPRYHPSIDFMSASHLEGGPQRVPLACRSFARPIARRLHHIDIGDTDTMPAGHRQRWHQYATALGYSLYFWHISDAAYILPQKNLEAFDLLLQKNMFVAAGQLMGISVLARQGGVLLGRHALPLMVDGRPIDLKALTPMRGLVIVAAPQSRLLKESSTWALSDLIMAAADHPVICKLEQSVADNVKSCLAHQITNPAFLTGSILLSQTLGGPFTLLPSHSAREVGVLEAVDLDR